MRFVFFGTDIEEQAVFYEEEAKNRFEEVGVSCEVSRGSAGVTLQLEVSGDNAETAEAILAALLSEAGEKFPRKTRKMELAAILAASEALRESGAGAVVSAGASAFSAEAFDKMFQKSDFAPKKEQSMGDFVRSLGKSKRR